MNFAGLYSCEVSADFPDYDTAIRRQFMHVFGESWLGVVVGAVVSVELTFSISVDVSLQESRLNDNEGILWLRTIVSFYGYL